MKDLVGGFDLKPQNSVFPWTRSYRQADIDRANHVEPSQVTDVLHPENSHLSPQHIVATDELSGFFVHMQQPGHPSCVTISQGQPSASGTVTQESRKPMYFN